MTDTNVENTVDLRAPPTGLLPYQHRPLNTETDDTIDPVGQSTALQPYKHRPLNPETTEIRLLRIERSNDEHSPIVLTLEHAFLSDKPAYHALSYCWGDESPLYEVTIHEGSTQAALHVRRNLYECLQDARTWRHAWLEGWIWIDQICIDQNNITERSHQVGLMGNLYANAEATLIWTGRIHIYEDFVPDDEVATADLKLDFETIEGIVNSFGDRIYPEYEPMPEESVELTVRKFLRGPLTSLLGSPYWRRTWIIQEIVLASRAYVLMADEMWDLVRLRGICDDLWWMLAQRQLIPDPVWEKYRKCRVQMAEICATKLQEIQDWHRVFQIAWKSDCKQPLDKFYAVMGLMPVERRLRVDYSIAEVNLLKNLLTNEMSILQGFSKDEVFHLVHIAEDWADWLKLDSGLPPSQDFKSDGPEDKGFEHEIRFRLYCHLKQLEIPIPFKLEEELKKSIGREMVSRRLRRAGYKVKKDDAIAHVSDRSRGPDYSQVSST